MTKCIASKWDGKFGRVSICDREAVKSSAMTLCPDHLKEYNSRKEGYTDLREGKG